jgi:hypothetical protein
MLTTKEMIGLMLAVFFVVPLLVALYRDDWR